MKISFKVDFQVIHSVLKPKADHQPIVGRLEGASHLPRHVEMAFLAASAGTSANNIKKKYKYKNIINIVGNLYDIFKYNGTDTLWLDQFCMRVAQTS